MKEILLIRLNKPHRKPIAKEKLQTLYPSCRILTLPDEMKLPDLAQTQWILRELDAIHNLHQADQHLLFNFAICIAINYAYNLRQKEKYIAVWFDDVKLYSQCLGNCITYMHYHPKIDGLGLPYEGEFKQVFARFFIYRMEKWKRIEWSWLWNQYHYPQIYIMFQEHLRKTEGLVTKLINQKGEVIDPSKAKDVLHKLGGVVL